MLYYSYQTNLFYCLKILKIKDLTMEYSVQIMQKRTYKPSETLESLDKIIGKFNNLVSLLIQEYLKELVELEQNNNEKIIFESYHIEDKHINKDNFDLVIEKYIKPIYPKSQLCNHSILFYVLHETFELFPNLFKMYCDENEMRDLLISQRLNATRDYTYHSGDRGIYENWVVEKCLNLKQQE